MGCILTFYNILLMLQILNNIEFDMKYVQRIRLSIVILLGTWLLSLDTQYSYTGILIENHGGAINANMFAILLLAVYFNFYLLIESSLRKRLIKKISLVSITALTIYYILISNCRIALIVIFVSLLGLLFKNTIKKNYKLFYKCILLCSFLFVILYIYLWFTKGINFYIMGKPFFTGRNYVWESTLELIKKYPIWGSGTEIMIQGFGNHIYNSAHNVYLAFWKTIGIIPTITFCIYFAKGKNMDNISDNNICAKIFLLSFIIISTTETIFNDSDIVLFIMMIFLTIKQNSHEGE